MQWWNVVIVDIGVGRLEGSCGNGSRGSTKPFALMACHVAYNPLPRLLFISSTLCSKPSLHINLAPPFPIVSLLVVPLVLQAHIIASHYRLHYFIPYP